MVNNINLTILTNFFQLFILKKICFSVLYKSLPTYYHSSYVVIVSINGQNSELLSSWPSWFGYSRTVENANKDILLCTVYGPAYEQGMTIDLTKYTVNDTIIRRWIPSQNRVKPNNIRTRKI